MSNSYALIYPVMAQVLWIFVVFVLLGLRRAAALRSRTVRLRDLALSDDAWPAEARKVSNNLRNQFETPILFFVLCGIATYLGPPSFLMTTLAWVYVATRVVHTVIHVTTNRVERRAEIFVLGLAILALMWSGLAGQLFSRAVY